MFLKTSGDVIIDELNEYLEDASILNEIKEFDDGINTYMDELESLEVLKDKCEISISRAEIQIKTLQKKYKDNNELKKQNMSLNTDIASLKGDLQEINKNIHTKNEDLKILENSKEEKIKKTLITLHEEIKKEYQRLDSKSTNYMELYNEMKVDMGILDRKLTFLKFMIYKRYDLRLQ